MTVMWVAVSKLDGKARLVSLLGLLLRPGMELLLFAAGSLAFHFGFGFGFEAAFGFGFATLHGAGAWTSPAVLPGLLPPRPRLLLRLLRPKRRSVMGLMELMQT